MLYVIATPIGNRGDWSARAIETLKSCSIILCEDTRHSLPLLQWAGISARLVSLHHFNEKRRIDEVIGWLQRGDSIGLISDAGTPAVSDPGALLVRAVWQAGFSASPIPGASAAIAAWSASGFGDGRSPGFQFIGFLPTDKKSRQQAIARMNQATVPTILYEAPHRLQATLHDLQKSYPADHAIFYGREISKIHEGFAHTSLGKLAHALSEQSLPALGEWVLIVTSAQQEIDTPTFTAKALAIKMQQHLRQELSPSALARAIHQITGLPRQQIYQSLLKESTVPDDTSAPTSD